MLTIFYISAIICFIYAIYGKARYPKLTCISETYYKGMPFTYWCWGVGMSLLPILLEITEDYYQFVTFLSCCGMIVLGTVPRYLDELSLAHKASVFWFGTLAVIWMFLSGFWWMPVLIVPLMLIGWKQSLFLAEIIGLLGLYLSLFLFLI